MFRTYAAQTSFLALATAWLLASTQIQRPENWSLAGLYLYWTVRIMIEAGLFIAFAELFSRLPGLKTNVIVSALLAAIVSLVPFALSITALDLILGLPELDGSISLDGTANGTSTDSTSAENRVGPFLREIIYLSDNHLALCSILTAPKLFEAFNQTRSIRANAPTRSEPPTNNAIDPQAEQRTVDPSKQLTETGYLRHLDQPLDGDLLRVEAQEHYIRLVTMRESRMVLYRFNDVVSELPANLGMQVHRSHWVAYAAAEGLHRDSGRLWLTMTDGSKIPISRKYSDAVKRRFGSNGQTAGRMTDGSSA